MLETMVLQESAWDNYKEYEFDLEDDFLQNKIRNFEKFYII